MSRVTRGVAVASAVALVLLALGATRGGGPATARAADLGTDTVTVHVFWADGCPHCAAEWAWVADLRDRHPDLEVVGHEITTSTEARDLWVAMSRARGVEPRGVPTTILEEQIWVGFDHHQTAPAIEAAVVRALDTRAGPLDEEPTGDDRASGPGQLDLPLVGTVDLESRSLLMSTVLIGFVDGSNPCSLWVLYVAFHRGPTLSIPERAKPAIYRRMRRITAHDAPLPAVLGGTALLAVGVSVVETPCTAGLPLVWSNLLAAREVVGLQALGLFGVYMTVFLLDELAVLAVAVVTMRAMRLQERHGRALKLGSGLVMLALAAALLVAPDLLLSVSGTAVVFGGAAAATAVVLLVERMRGNRGTGGTGGTTDASGPQQPTTVP